MATKLLLVEDSLSIQTIVETTFAREGFAVLVVSDALEALHHLQTFAPDIVLADAAMQGIDGFQLCHRIRHSPHGQHLPVVLLTSGFTAYDVTKGERVGVTAHITKPFEPRQLLDLVKQLLPPASPRPVEARALLPGPAPMSSEEPFDAVWGDAPPLDDPPGLAPWEETGTTAAFEAAAIPGPLAAIPLPSEPLPVAMGGVAQALGDQLMHSLRATLEAQMAALCAQIMPQLLATAREVVQTQMPDLLAALLQQEIAKLKQAVEHDQSAE